MSSATYYITIKNESTQNQSYLIFSQPPKDSAKLGEAWANVWVKTGGTPTPNGSQKIVIRTDNFAVCGTTPTPLANGVSVTESDWTPVVLSTNTTPGTAPVMQIVSGTPAFTQPYSTVDLPNSFGIKINPFDPAKYPNTYCGYGKYDMNKEVVPVAVWASVPNVTIELTPVVTFYVATGSYEAGTVVNKTVLGGAKAIDFTTALSGQTVATIVHQRDGTYSGPVFSYPPTKNRPSLE